ncbi:MAG: hypothetical protein NTV34_03835, partial [Proteobacteria bacterium]|nr:hypothetical protein [Pseudomonadota bacterium]
ITQTDFIKKAGSRSALARLKASFSPESTRMLKLLEGIDLTKLLKAQQAAGSLDKARIASVQQELQLQNFRVQLANSLDLIGIFEAITGDDITLLSKERIRSRIEKSPIIRDLMMYATKLNFRSQ